MRGSSLLIGVICGLLLTTGCGPEPAVDSGGSLASTDGRIAFMRSTGFDGPDIESDVFTINADGSDEKRLTDTPGLDGFPSWSPDGERIVYTAFSGGTTLAVMNADGSGRRGLGATLVRRLTGTAYAEEPAWSPDGERIAFVSTPFMGDEEIYVINPDGTGRRRLTDIPGADHWPPTWSPEGDRIAFTSDGTEEVGEIYVMNADGSGLTRLTRNPADDSFPAWQP